jgi:hypothetical protein
LICSRKTESTTTLSSSFTAAPCDTLRGGRILQQIHESGVADEKHKSEKNNTLVLEPAIERIPLGEASDEVQPVVVAMDEQSMQAAAAVEQCRFRQRACDLPSETNSQTGEQFVAIAGIVFRTRKEKPVWLTQQRKHDQNCRLSRAPIIQLFELVLRGKLSVWRGLSVQNEFPYI